MREILLINIVGTDRPGLTHALTSILAHYSVRVLDIGQAVIHDHLSLGILAELPEGESSYRTLKELLFEAHKLGLSIRFTPVAEGEYEEWVANQTQERTILTVLGRTIGAETLSQLTRAVADQGLNIEKISRLSQRVSLEQRSEQQRSCIEFSLLGEPQAREAMRAEMMQIALEDCVDIAIQSDDRYRRNRRLVVFDMDSTLIQCEVIDELARLAGVYDKVAAITEEAMQGKLDFQSSFRKRLAMLKGLKIDKVYDFAENLPLTDGAERLVTTLKQLGYKTAICSGGFSLFGQKLQERLGIDYVYANELNFIDGVLTGEVHGEIVDGAVKARFMRELATELGLDLRQVVAVGDGANDLPMIQQAGLGIAFRAKPLVRENAKQSLSVLGLDGILYLLGVRDRELAR